MKKFIEIAGNTAPYLIVGLVFAVTVSALVSLVLVDVITGQITGDYLSNDKWFGLFGSLAGTGMLIACGVLIANLWEKEQYTAAFVVIFVFLALQSADVYFDGISVDIKRFGHIVSTSSFDDKPEALAHNIYRFFISGISFVGEPLGVGSLVAFPLLKKWLMGILEISEKKDVRPQPRRVQSYRPDPSKIQRSTVQPDFFSSLPKKPAQNRPVPTNRPRPTYMDVPQRFAALEEEEEG